MTEMIEQIPQVHQASPVVTSRADAVQAAPSVEAMLMLAIENKVNPDTLERLMALQERVMAQRAEQAFNVAMAAFRAECPSILKKNEALDKSNRVMYRYSDLSEITKQIDPVLQRHGLTYTWDTDLVNDQTTVTCHVHHIDGHKRSAKFTCKGSGTSIMNAAQIAASATTFGRRYSLTAALGLTTDLDDDGRRAAPMPRPDHDPAAPKVKPRAERAAQADDGIPYVTAASVNAVLTAWQKKKSPKGTRSEFAAWARGVLLTECSMEKLSDWSVDAIDACKEALQ